MKWSPEQYEEICLHVVASWLALGPAEAIRLHRTNANAFLLHITHSPLVKVAAVRLAANCSLKELENLIGSCADAWLAHDEFALSLILEHLVSFEPSPQPKKPLAKHLN